MGLRSFDQAAGPVVWAKAVVTGIERTATGAQIARKAIKRSSRRCMLCQVARQERESALAPEAVGPVEDFLLGIAGDAEDLVHFLDPLEACPAGGYGEDIVALAGFEERRTRGDQARDIVHFGPVRDAGNVVIDAVRSEERRV